MNDKHGAIYPPVGRWPVCPRCNGVGYLIPPGLPGGPTSPALHCDSDQLDLFTEDEARTEADSFRGRCFRQLEDEAIQCTLTEAGL